MVSLPRCSLRGRSGARHARGAARGSAPPIPYVARRGHRSPGRDGKAGSSIKLESGVCCGAARRPPVMHFYSGPPMHLLSGVDTQPATCGRLVLGVYTRLQSSPSMRGTSTWRSARRRIGRTLCLNIADFSHVIILTVARVSRRSTAGRSSSVWRNSETPQQSGAPPSLQGEHSSGGAPASKSSSEAPWRTCRCHPADFHVSECSAARNSPQFTQQPYTAAPDFTGKRSLIPPWRRAAGMG